MRILVQKIFIFQAAAGYKLPKDQKNLEIFGHSIEARIYAEVPEKNFMPDTGKLQLFKAPPNSANVRIETGVKQSKDFLKSTFKYNCSQMMKFQFIMIL